MVKVVIMFPWLLVIMDSQLKGTCDDDDDGVIKGIGGRGGTRRKKEKKDQSFTSKESFLWLISLFLLFFN